MMFCDVISGKKFSAVLYEWSKLGHMKFFKVARHLTPIFKSCDMCHVTSGYKNINKCMCTWVIIGAYVVSGKSLQGPLGLFFAVLILFQFVAAWTARRCRGISQLCAQWAPWRNGSCSECGDWQRWALMEHWLKKGWLCAACLRGCFCAEDKCHWGKLQVLQICLSVSVW